MMIIAGAAGATGCGKYLHARYFGTSLAFNDWRLPYHWPADDGSPASVVPVASPGSGAPSAGRQVGDRLTSPVGAATAVPPRLTPPAATAEESSADEVHPPVAPGRRRPRPDRGRRHRRPPDVAGRPGPGRLEHVDPE